jgi:hypothetical protein
MIYRTLKYYVNLRQEDYNYILLVKYIIIRKNNCGMTLCLLESNNDNSKRHNKVSAILVVNILVLTCNITRISIVEISQSN